MDKRFGLDVHHWSTEDVMGYSVDVFWKDEVPKQNKQPSLMVRTQDNGFEHMMDQEVCTASSIADRPEELKRQPPK